MPRRRAGLPDAQKPNKIEPLGGKLIELPMRDVVERCLSPKYGGKLRKSDPRVDLK
jgi:hypothetical protein